MTTGAPVIATGSTNGQPIKIAATSTPGTAIHTATNTAGVVDEVWLWAVNTSAASVLLTIQWGGVAAPDNSIPITLPAQCGLALVVPGCRVNGGVLIKAFAGTTNVILIIPNVNRLTTV